MFILSILSIFRKSRNSIYYKVISYTIKLIIEINLVWTSGLFFSLVDLSTPIDSILSLYSDLLNPYIEVLKSKVRSIYNVLSNLDDSILSKYDAYHHSLNKVEKVDELIDF